MSLLPICVSGLLSELQSVDSLGISVGIPGLVQLDRAEHDMRAKEHVVVHDE